LRIPLFKNTGIPKIPGLKRQNKKEKCRRGLSKELDHIVENEELENSPLKSGVSGSQNEILNFEMGMARF